MAWGQGSHPDNSDDTVKHHRFSYFLAQDLNLEEKNVAVPGCSNARIARTSLVDLVEYRPTYAIILWSMPSRIEFTDYRGDPYKWNVDALQLRESSVKSSNLPKTLRMSLSMYYKNLSSVYSDVANSIYHMANIKILCDSLNIKCLQMWITDSCLEMVQEASESPREDYIHTFKRYQSLLESDSNVYSHSGCTFASISGYNYTNPPIDYHITAEGHKLAYQWFKEALL